MYLEISFAEWCQFWPGPSSPVRANYEVAFVNSRFDQSCDFVIALLYAISRRSVTKFNCNLYEKNA